jgi:hypothetical protein
MQSIVAPTRGQQYGNSRVLATTGDGPVLGGVARPKRACSANKNYTGTPDGDDDDQDREQPVGKHVKLAQRASNKAKSSADAKEDAQLHANNAHQHRLYAQAADFPLQLVQHPEGAPASAGRKVHF